MTESNSFTGQSRAIRRLCERVIELDQASPTFAAELASIKEAMKNLIDSVPNRRGNPNVAGAVAASVASRKQRADIRRHDIGAAIRKLRKEGKYTYRELAEGLNAMGFVPERAEKWTAGLARAFDPDLARK